eukprot:TRINITY_DN17501_c2_g1_i2.p3 TRINITY_DN17501_c2_g1~~TRINITY_DN17501_c2_g1_i2.p3  ORF type:complete len:139 (-),score=1.28 TRINITY_DN17501_c2_g1_i2:1015-1431(-)
MKILFYYFVIILRCTIPSSPSIFTYQKLKVLNFQVLQYIVQYVVQNFVYRDILDVLVFPFIIQTVKREICIQRATYFKIFPLKIQICQMRNLYKGQKFSKISIQNPNCKLQKNDKGRRNFLEIFQKLANFFFQKVFSW